MLSQKTVENIGGHFGKVHAYMPTKSANLNNSIGRVKKRKIDKPKVSVSSLPKRIKQRSVSVKKKKTKLNKRNISAKRVSKVGGAPKAKKRTGKKTAKVKSGRKAKKGGATRKGNSGGVKIKNRGNKKSASKVGYGSIFG